MDSIIRIGCPVCGAVLKTIDDKSNQGKSVTCPVCHKKSPYTSFKMIAPQDDEPTQYPEKYASDKESSLVGMLQLVTTHDTYPLHLGKNIIGRQATGSTAHIQLPCSTRRMSREHIIIDVKDIPGKGITHYLSLAKQQVNATYLADTPLSFGDIVILKHNDLIALPDLTVRFLLPDDEGTEMAQ